MAAKRDDTVKHPAGPSWGCRSILVALLGSLDRFDIVPTKTTVMVVDGQSWMQPQMHDASHSMLCQSLMCASQDLTDFYRLGYEELLHCFEFASRLAIVWLTGRPRRSCHTHSP